MQLLPSSSLSFFPLFLLARSHEKAFRERKRLGEPVGRRSPEKSKAFLLFTGPGPKTTYRTGNRDDRVLFLSPRRKRQGLWEVRK